MIGNLLYITGFLVGWSCVGPPEYSDGLLINTPAIFNQTDVFSFNLKGEDFTTEERYNLKLNLDTTSVIQTTYIVKDLQVSDQDSTSFLFYASDTNIFFSDAFPPIDASTTKYYIDTNRIETTLDSVKYSFPLIMDFKSNNFSGYIYIQLIKK